MKEFISETHKATIDDEGLLRVDQLTPRQLRVEQHSAEGVMVDILDAKTATGPEWRMLRAMSRHPIFAAGYCGESEWTADIDCGMQRWRGSKTSKEMSKALSNCGFDTKTKKEIMAECRKHKCDHVPWYN